jgi:hypothetical protein
MSAISSASGNPLLTSYAQAIIPDLESSQANFIAPQVVAPSARSRYKIYNEVNSWQTYETQRAIGGPATRIPWLASDGQLNLEPHALENPIDDFEREDTADLVGLQQSKVRSLLSSATLSNEKDLFTYIKANVSAEGGKGTWNASTDPIEQLDEQLVALETALGRRPNRILMGTLAWQIMRDNAKTQARFKSGFASITRDMVSNVLIFPCEIQIGGLIYNAAQPQATKNKARNVGSDVFLFYADQNPTMEDPSFAKTFTTGRGGITSVRTYREEGSRSDIVAVDWNRQFAITNSEGVKRLTVTSS